MKKILVITACLLIVLPLCGQSKKERKKFKIKATTEYETSYEHGSAVTYKSSYEEFDRDGRTILSITYGPGGEVLTKSTSRYDQFKNKIEETEFDAQKQKNTRKTYKYNSFRDKTEEVEYNSSGSVVKKIIFTYDGDGNKTSEITYDGSGTMLKKATFTYNNKNLKTARKTVNGRNNPVSDKKWEYLFF